MTGPQHYHEAERCIKEAFACQHPEQDWLSTWNLQLAQVHATLALASATAIYEDWSKVIRGAEMPHP